MDFNEALSYLLSLGHETLTIKLGLENTITLLGALGDPHRQFHSVQIAGTNGKGSTAVMLDSICRQAGIRTGLFTSPHLISITERISLNGHQISEDDFAQITARVSATAEELVSQRRLETLPTFFEHITAIALLAFAEANLELVILETGLGGRLDSTTAAGAEIAGITPIAMDHEEYLGHSLAEIAAEKAAIIRPGVKAIVAPQSPEAFEVIVKQCERCGVEPILLNNKQTQITAAAADGRLCVNLQTENDRYDEIRLALRGRHQATNAAMAVALAEALRECGFTISREAIIRGVETAEHPGRLELFEGSPQILFDGAHNPAAARVLVEYLDEFVKRPITMIFGAMQDKALAGMAGVLFRRADEVILTELDNPRAASVETLVAITPEGCDRTRVHVAKSSIDAWRIAKRITSPDGLICVTGSLYLIGEIRKALDSSTALLSLAPSL
jgi:dihydrofolate synthase / folylpolyglutamate synthase